MSDDESTIESAAPDEPQDQPEGRWVSTDEAAGILGLSARTVRRRIDTGTLKGERVEHSHAFRVWIEGDAAAASAAGEEQPGDETTTEQGSDAIALPAGDPIVWALSDHLADLTRQNAELTKRIEVLAAEAATYRERVRIYEEQARALPAGESPAWRPWWKRFLGIE